MIVLVITGLVSRVVLDRPEIKKGQSANLQYILWTATNPNCDGNFCSESYVKYYAQADPDRAKLVSPALWHHISTMSAEQWRHLLWYKIASTYVTAPSAISKRATKPNTTPTPSLWTNMCPAG